MSRLCGDVSGPQWASVSDHHRTWSGTVLLHRWTRLLDCVNRQRLGHPNVKSHWPSRPSEPSSPHLPRSESLCWLWARITVFAHHRCSASLVWLRFLIFFLLLLLLSPHSCWCHSQGKSSWNHLPPHTHQTVHHSRLHSTHPHHSTSAIDDLVLVSQHQTYLEKYQNRRPELRDVARSVSSSGVRTQHSLHQSRPSEFSQIKCVEQCSCKWRSGKMWVECIDASLQHVPRGLNLGTQVLHLSGNPLAELEARVFERAGLSNLQRLYLARCRLRDIHVDAFQQLSNLIELDLAQNQLSNIPTGSLYHCPFLRKLNLARNQIRIVKNSALATLEKLQFIDISGNGLELIEPEAFFGLKALKQLHLHDNQLRSVDAQTMSSLPEVYELTLQHNPWRCDCTLRAFRNWMLEHRISLSYSPNCSTPTRLMAKPWSQLDLDEFACPPEVVSVKSEVVVYEGENASIGCVMAAIPNVHIEWEWRGKTIRNMSLMTFGRQMYLIRESYSPAGVTMSILPVNRDQEDGSDLDVPEEPEDLLVSEGASQQDLMMQSAVVQPQQESHWLERRARGVRSAQDNEGDTYQRTSTLYIMNALEKDSGSYVCTGSNKAGIVSANVTLTVLRRLEVTAAAYSGEEVAGIVLGALLVFLLTFVVVCFVVLRSKKGSNCGRGETTTTLTTNTSQSNGTLNSNQMLLTTVAANGRIANGHLPNGHVRQHSNTSTDTKESKMSSLIVSLNGAHNGNGTVKRFVVLPEESQEKINIRTNQLAEQFELCHYPTPKVDSFPINSGSLSEMFDSGRVRALPDVTHQLPNGPIYTTSSPSPNPLYPLSSANHANFTPTELQYSMPTRNYPTISSVASSLYNSIASSDDYSVPVGAKSPYNHHYYTLDAVQQSPVRCLTEGLPNSIEMMPKVDLVNEMNKRRAATSVAEELQSRLAASGGQMKRNSSLDMAPSSMVASVSNQGQMVRFANSPTVYSYPATGAPSSVVMMPSSAKQASPLNRVRNGANPVIARDSPDEGLGEETDCIE